VPYLQVNRHVLFDSDKTQEFAALQNIHELDDESCYLGFDPSTVLSLLKVLSSKKFI
jgi:hypothetical protein